MDLPALFLLIKQRHRNARNVKALSQYLKLLLQHIGQTGEAAQAQLFADPGREKLVLFAAARLSTFNQHIADVQQLQQPVVRQRKDPAAQVQWVPADAVKVQVEDLALPVGGDTFDDQAAVGHQVIEQRWCLCGEPLRGERMAQWAGQVQHPAFAIQVHLQADTRHAQGVRRNLRWWRLAVEQAPEEFFPGIQNCRLELAERVVGRLGTAPMPGSTRNGSTWLSLVVGESMLTLS